MTPDAPLPRSGLYFIDVLACLLFCITLALVGARFGSEHSVPIELPSLREAPSSAAGLSGETVTLRDGDDGLEVHWKDARLSLEELEARLRAAPPASLLVRAENSPLSRVIAVAHAAGVHDIQVAYRASRGDPP